MTTESIRKIAACDGFECRICHKKCGLDYTPRTRESELAREYCALLDASESGDTVLSASFSALQWLECFAIMNGANVGREDREHIASVIKMLREICMAKC